MERARRDIADNNLAGAIKKLNTCINSQPYFYEAYFLRGGCKFNLEDNVGAEQDFTTSLTVYEPYYYEALHYRAQARYRLTNYQGSITDLNKIIDKYNSNPLLFIERAYAYLAMNDFDAAISDCNQALTLKVKGEDVYLCLGAANDALTFYPKAIEAYDRAIEINPQNLNCYVRRGITKYKTNHYKEAIEDYEQAIAIDSSYTFAYYNRAESKIKLNKNKEALSDYNIVLTYEPRNAYALFNRAVLYSTLKNYKSANSDFDKVLIINPENIQALFNRAKLKQNLKEYKGAIKDYDRIIELYPYFMDAYYNKAQIKYLLNDSEGAKKDLATGKLMSEVLHAKSESQLSRDSIQISKLMALDADFNNRLNDKTDTINIGIQPMFYLIEKEVNSNNCKYLSSLLNTFNKDHDYKLCICNSESTIINDIDSLIFSGEERKVSLFSAVVKSNMHAYDLANSDFDKLILNDSTNALAYFGRGINTFSEVQAMVNIEQPNVVVNSNNYSFQNQRTEKLQSALSDFSRAIELQKQFEFAYYNRAQIKALLHDFNGALKDYETTLDINPQLAEAYYNKAFVLYYLNEKKIACSIFSKAGELGLSSAYRFIKRYCN